MCIARDLIQLVIPSFIAVGQTIFFLVIKKVTPRLTQSKYSSGNDPRLSWYWYTVQGVRKSNLFYLFAEYYIYAQKLSSKEWSVWEFMKKS